MEKKYQKILIFCNTYMQIINAVQIKRFFFRNTKTDILISDHSRNTEGIVERLNASSIFQRVKHVDTKYIDYQQSLWEDIKDIYSVNFGKNKTYKKYFWEQDFDYDLILFYNVSMLVYSAFIELLKKGITPDCIRFEEGINSYQSITKPPSGNRIKITEFLQKLIFKRSLIDCIHRVFCYFPELFPAEDVWKIYQIPPLKREDQELVKVLNAIFGYSPKLNEFSQKYIYFATSADIDGNSVGETNLVLQLSNMLGKENLIIKVHPRDNRTIYEEAGLCVDRNSSVPWEVVQLNHDFSKSIFLSLSSGSILTASAMLGDNIESYYLFPIVQGKNTYFDLHTSKVLSVLIQQLHEHGRCPRCRTVNSTEELQKSIQCPQLNYKSQKIQKEGDRTSYGPRKEELYE